MFSVGRSPNDYEDAHTPDHLQELLRFQLNSPFEAERRPVEGEVYWERVRAVEKETGRPFAEVVHDLRLQRGPDEVPGLLGVTRHFLYDNFGWAMDKIAYVERLYGMALGQVVALKRAKGVRMVDMATAWGLAVTTLYNALRRFEVSMVVPTGPA